MNQFKTPALNETSCTIRRITNYCEKIARCQSRVDWDTRLPCSVDNEKPRNASVIGLIEIATDMIGGIDTTSDDVKTIDDTLTEALELLGYAKKMAAEVSGKIGIGL